MIRQVKKAAPYKKKVLKKPKKKVKKSSKKQDLNSHSEAKGFFFVAFSIFFLISLLSFNQGNQSVNWLGIIGYNIALFSNYIFGLGSYFVAGYIFWMGINFLAKKQIPKLGYKSLCFFGALLSFNMVINVIAESYTHKLAFFKNRVYTEQIQNSFTYVQSHIRYNLGGVPLYYIFRDLPILNLQKLLSNIGVSLTFSATGFISFIVLTNIQVFPNVLAFLLFLPKIFIKTFVGIYKIIKACFMGFSKACIAIFNFLKKIKIERKVKPKIIKPILPKKPLINKQVFTNSFPKIPNEQPIKKSFLQNPFSSKKPIQQNPRKMFSQTSKGLIYELPTETLLTSAPKIDQPTLEKELKKQSQVLQDTLENFGIKASVGNICCGPTITSFEVEPSVGVKVQKIKALENDIALNMQAKSIRIIAPIPGKAVVGVEVPSIYPQTVSFKEMMQYYRNFSKKKLNIPLLLGKSVSGEYIISDLSKMPHLLIAGATGAGKSVCINSIVMSIVMNASYEEIKLLLIDPKKVELTGYSNLPHMIAPVITEPHGAYAALQWLVKEMKLRYDILKLLGLRNISAFNDRTPNLDIEKAQEIEIPKKMPFIVAIIDEFADLMMVSSSDLETPITRIAQMARAVGIHLILATQRPSREVITGIIKANFPCRIAFKVSSRINSQIILDETGADSLLGNGDLLFLPPGTSHLIRAQGSFISDNDINRTVTAIIKKYPQNYLIPSFDKIKLNLSDQDKEKSDPLYENALQAVLIGNNASTTYLQRKLKIGYARAASLMDELENYGIISPPEGSKPRQILLSTQERAEFLDK
jgi:DNA segregation ATPase FtsK/SpoIIIE, S-DNA-T family